MRRSGPSVPGYGASIDMLPERLSLFGSSSRHPFVTGVRTQKCENHLAEYAGRCSAAELISKQTRIGSPYESAFDQ
jgi:hypothetical protein